MKLMHPASSHEIEVDQARAGYYISQGWRQIADDAPKGNAPLSVWQEYARAQGFDESDIKGKTRAELRAALA